MPKRIVIFVFQLGFLLCLFYSCRQKSFEVYNKDDFYKAQGVIITAKMTNTILNDPFMKEIEFEYFVNDSLILTNSEDLSFMD